MSIEIKVPPLPESVSDATLVAWHKKVGDSVSRDENLVDLETDKVVLEVPAPSAGKLDEIRIDDGATVTAGQVLAILVEGEAASPAPAATAAAAASTETAESPEETVQTARKMSPAVRRLIEETDAALERLLPSGGAARGAAEAHV